MHLSVKDEVEFGLLGHRLDHDGHFETLVFLLRTNLTHFEGGTARGRKVLIIIIILDEVVLVEFKTGLLGEQVLPIIRMHFNIIMIK